MLTKNGFSHTRSRDHEIWLRHDEAGKLANRVTVSHGNDEIRTRGLFKQMLRQAGKTEEHFYDVLRGNS